MHRLVHATGPAYNRASDLGDACLANVLIATPAYNGSIDVVTYHSVFALADAIRKRGGRVLIRTKVATLIDRALPVGRSDRPIGAVSESNWREIRRWCPLPDSNQHSFRKRILSAPRLPIPPKGHRTGPL